MIIVMGTVRVPVENIEAIRPMMAKVIAATLAEDGCVQYAYGQDVLDPELIHIAEKWRDKAALEAHFAAPHMKVWAQERATLGLFDRRIRMFEADEGVEV
ncbi:antibiotic biosynthesis monooxygenase [Novosphingobium sp. ERN07]|uniref:putative quinol monooxygenase n=1 Tax=Novosphingobium sp. ERN07 TaxID=2726187 RepID=UPI001457426F|nr:putative quinol monooxygenase [Novosphingobium sp. ERN07]NLR71100.1 antibiotic biosynthesis monooxygenase [Novosphingobium sp. ERN07]